MTLFSTCHSLTLFFAFLTIWVACRTILYLFVCCLAGNLSRIFFRFMALRTLMSLVLAPYVGGSIFPCMYVDGVSVTIKLLHTSRPSLKRYFVLVCCRRGHRLYNHSCVVVFRPIRSLYVCAPGACEFTYTPGLSSAPIDTQGVCAVTREAASHARMRAHTLTRK